MHSRKSPFETFTGTRTPSGSLGPGRLALIVLQGYFAGWRTLNKASIPSHRTTRNLLARGTHLHANQLYSAANSNGTACHLTPYARYWWTTYSHSKKPPHSAFFRTRPPCKIRVAPTLSNCKSLPTVSSLPSDAAITLSGMLSPLSLLLSRHLLRKRHRLRPNERSSGCSLVKEFLNLRTIVFSRNTQALSWTFGQCMYGFG